VLSRAAELGRACSHVGGVRACTDSKPVLCPLLVVPVASGIRPHAHVCRTARAPGMHIHMLQQQMRPAHTRARKNKGVALILLYISVPPQCVRAKTRLREAPRGAAYLLGLQSLEPRHKGRNEKFQGIPIALTTTSHKPRVGWVGSQNTQTPTPPRSLAVGVATDCEAIHEGHLHLHFFAASHQDRTLTLFAASQSYNGPKWDHEEAKNGPHTNFAAPQ